ncbi:MAG: glycine--tRNA ligase subunit beta, partial [Pseudomonadota bacterium]
MSGAEATVADLLLEFFSEEIPARMQARAAADLRRLTLEALSEAGLKPSAMETFAGPRRLALHAADLPIVQPDRREERKGPRVGAPDKAIAGFLRGAGLESVDACEIREDGKGQYYVAVRTVEGGRTADVIERSVGDIIRNFPWPKSQRWGDGALRWVRPLHSILCVFDGAPLAFSVDGVPAGGATRGHRVHGGDA